MGIFRPTAMVIAALVCTLIVQESSALQRESYFQPRRHLNEVFERNFYTVERCLLPPESGPCMGYFMRYAYDARSGQCVKFVYGGCQGNGNRFDSKEECEDQCARTLYDFA
ncbi:uncharacterized protein DEA37_0003861 [Paragonimus westermani]|uniref:BPTI/Kunitz inhibitor domain-containing protein n=2 Tax=Paragonimus westermani TaxID=34504 RepID=A0A5J4N889_9TREM|nr:uncharacterized protein DEA37_0003861 [Paragonimus westermani]